MWSICSTRYRLAYVHALGITPLPPHTIPWIFQLPSYTQTLIYASKNTCISLYVCWTMLHIVYSHHCHAVFISVEASSEPCVVPVTIPSPRRQWNLPRKNTIISSSSRELSAGENKWVLTFVRQWTIWNSYSTQFEEWNDHQSLSVDLADGWRALFYACKAHWSSFNWLKKQHYHHFSTEFLFSNCETTKEMPSSLWYILHPWLTVHFISNQETARRLHLAVIMTAAPLALAPYMNELGCVYVRVWAQGL